MSPMAAPAPTTATLPTALVCAGCGTRLGGDEMIALSCPAARPGDDIDHVLLREIDPALVRFPADPDPNPFVRYRTLLHGYHLARARGRSDADVTALIRRLDDAVAAVDGHGFRATPLLAGTPLDGLLGFEAPGGLLVKDETGNVSGSHKARHLFGTLVELELGDAPADRPLAIASCGNAALAAAVVARAAGRSLTVFIPPDADANVVARLTSLGASVDICERQPGIPGDPTYHRLAEALARGALAFTCQGNLNGLAIEGGETLGYELVDELRVGGHRFDHLVVQVGGGALAASCARAFADAHALGAIADLPRLHTVQTQGAFPLRRAYRRVTARLVRRLGLSNPSPAALREAVATASGRDELAWIARHRSRFMWPWETEPHSVATGILDDETYDWMAVVTAMLETGGEPIVVDEGTLTRANGLAVEATGIDVDPTGSAGLAGVLALLQRGVIGADETVGVLFTGIRRTAGGGGARST
jgi:threonine synthase